MITFFHISPPGPPRGSDTQTILSGGRNPPSVVKLFDIKFIIIREPAPRSGNEKI